MCDFVERARNNFLQGYSCAQSVLLAFAEPLGMSNENALLLSSSFGAGLGRLREVCGALSALMMVHGMLEGYTTTDSEKKAKHFARVQELAGLFRDEMGSIVCRELLGDHASTNPVPEERTEEYYASRPCLKAVECAARLGQEIVEAKKIKQN